MAKRRKRTSIPYVEWRQEIDEWLARLDAMADDQTTVACWCLKVNHCGKLYQSEFEGPVFELEKPGWEDVLGIYREEEESDG